ncbi:MAG TPA: SapC family protein [Burkholderiaceae bacterium]|jgi:hypothetical protein
MLFPTIIKSPSLLDPARHKGLRLMQDTSAIHCVENANLVFIGVQEFEQACREFPILFLKAGSDAFGKPLVAPVAVMGLQDGENLYFRHADGGGHETEWTGRYVPAFLRFYPFALTQVDESRWGMCIDEAWRGWSTTEGSPLFAEDGAPTEFVSGVCSGLQALEQSIEQTRLMGERLMQMGLLVDRQFNVNLPDESSYSVTGFMAVDEQRLAGLSRVELSELNRTGWLYSLHLHKASLRNLDDLAQRRWALSL